MRAAPPSFPAALRGVCAHHLPFRRAHPSVPEPSGREGEEGCFYPGVLCGWWGDAGSHPHSIVSLLGPGGGPPPSSSKELCTRHGAKGPAQSLQQPSCWQAVGEETGTEKGALRLCWAESGSGRKPGEPLAPMGHAPHGCVCPLPESAHRWQGTSRRSPLPPDRSLSPPSATKL